MAQPAQLDLFHASDQHKVASSPGLASQVGIIHHGDDPGAHNTVSVPSTFRFEPVESEPDIISATHATTNLPASRYSIPTVDSALAAI